MTEETTGKKALEVFQTRVRQLMYEFERIRDQRNGLQAQIAEMEAQATRTRQEIESLRRECQSLKTARMLEINDGDVEKSKKRLDSLVRQVDRCIALLNV